MTSWEQKDIPINGLPSRELSMACLDSKFGGLCNLEIGAQFPNSKNVQCNLEIVQFPRLCGTFPLDLESMGVMCAYLIICSSGFGLQAKLGHCH